MRRRKRRVAITVKMNMILQAAARAYLHVQFWDARRRSGNQVGGVPYCMRRSYLVGRTASYATTLYQFLSQLPCRNCASR